MIELIGKNGTVLGRWKRGEKVPLIVRETLWIEPISKALIRHDAVQVAIRKMEDDDEGMVMLLRAPGSFNIGLLVDQGPIEEGELFTPCFNLLDQRLRIAKGEVVSWLVEL